MGRGRITKVPRGEKRRCLFPQVGRIRCNWEKKGIIVTGYETLKIFEPLQIKPI